MYIDTHTKETMITSLCEYLNASKESLVIQINTAIDMAKNEAYFNEEKFHECIVNYVSKCKPIRKIDTILFFHLSRRLNIAINDNCLNLRGLLLEKNAFSDFIAESNVTFKENEDHIDVYLSGILQDLHSDKFEDRVYLSLLKRRLGQAENMKDYCINGFSFGDQLHRNAYTSGMRCAPELIRCLSHVLKIPDMIKKYGENSKFYCYEFLIPLDTVILDGKEDLSEVEKELQLVVSVCYRIYEYMSESLICDENPILRLDDTTNMRPGYYINRIEM